MTRFAIGRDLASFLEGGNSMLVATRSASLGPDATRASGLRVLSPQRIAVFLPQSSSAQALANLAENGEIAVCASYPRTFRTYQLKGRCVAVTACSADDLMHCERQMRGFADAVADFGYSRAQSRNLWLFDVVRLEVQVTSAFAQTPGRGAGARMEDGDVG